MIHLLLILILLPFNLMAQIEESIKNLDPNKFTVCAITINSTEEREVFKTQTSKYPSSFNPIVELTEFSGENWFDKACESKVKCDQLVISGHFAGTFFGSSNKRLPIDLLESKSCSNTCPGILNDPYEVFLFGCNTLAGKEKDHRTPEQYRQVLIHDGFSEDEARMVAEYRYGQTGSDFKSTMQRSFGGDKKQLYGFSSVGPLGKNVEAFLQKYFAKINSKSHLEKLQAKRLLDKVDMTNMILADSLKTTAFTQCESSNKEMDKESKLMCLIMDEEASLDDRISAITEAFTSDAYLKFIPSINIFLQKNKISSLSPKHQKDLEVITKNSQIRNQIEKLINSTNDLKTLVQWTQFADSIGINTSMEKLNNELSKLFLRFKTVSIRDKDTICGLSKDLRSRIKIDHSQMNYPLLMPIQQELLSCLAFNDREIQLLILKSELSSDHISYKSPLASWSRENDLHQDTMNIIIDALSSDHKNPRTKNSYLFNYLSNNRAADRQMQKKLLALSKDHPTHNNLIVTALGKIPSDDDEILKEVLILGDPYTVLEANPKNKIIAKEALQNATALNQWSEDDKVAMNVIRYLEKNPNESEEIQLRLINLTGSSDLHSNAPKSKEAAREYFKKHPTKNLKVVSEMLKNTGSEEDNEFFKTQLESFNGLPAELQKTMMNEYFYTKNKLAIFSLYPKSLTKETLSSLKKEMKTYSEKDKEAANKILQEAK